MTASVIRINGTNVSSGGPRGLPGAPGINWLGAWSSATAYTVGDAVSRSGDSFICILAHTNQTPTTGASIYWDTLAEGGIGGGGGQVDTVVGTAPISVNEDDPSSPIVSISAATTIAAGSMSATDKSKLDGIETGATADQVASEVPFTPAGTIASSTTQAAVEEVATDAASALSTHAADTTAIHGITDTSVLETTTGSQAKVDTHVNDTSAAHNASAIAFTPNGSIAADNVQAAIQEVRDEAVGGGSDDQTAAEVPFTPSGTISSNNVQDAIEEVAAEASGTDDQTAAEVPFTPAGTISASNTQAAVEEVATDAATALSTHESDTSNVHGITDTSVLETTTGSQTKVDTHVNDTSAAHAASAISYAGGTGMAADNVESAIDELATEKVMKSGDTLTGALVSSGYPTANLHLANRFYADAGARRAAYKIQQKMTHDLTDVNIVILGDSTSIDRSGAGIPNATNWFGQLATFLAAQYPLYDVAYRLYTTGSNTYAAETVVQSGASSNKLTIWVGAANGERLDYFLGTRITASLVTPNPDLVLIAHGHNESSISTDSTELLNTTRMFGNFEQVQQAVPRANIVVVAQNANSASSGNRQKNYALAFGRVCATRGYGFIDVNQAFLDDGRDVATVLTSDGTHPTQVGYDVWSAAVNAAFAKSSGATQVAGIVQSRFEDAPAGNLVKNGRFSDWTTSPGAPPEWTLTGATATKNVTQFESGGGWALRLQASGAAASSISQVALSSTTIKPFLGKYVTVNVRMYVPAGQTAAGIGSVRLADGVDTVTGINATQPLDGFFNRSAAIKVSSSATGLTVTVFGDTASNASADITIQEITLHEGQVPRGHGKELNAELKSLIVRETTKHIGAVTIVDAAADTSPLSQGQLKTGTFTLSNKTLTLPEINDTSSDHQYVFAVSELAADRTITLPLLTAGDTFVFNNHIQTLTNKRVTKRALVLTATNVTAGAVDSFSTDSYDVVHLTGLDEALTSWTLTGTPVEGDTLRIDITDNGTARALTWTSTYFEASGTIALPTTTVLGVRLDVGFVRNTVTGKWRCVGVA